MWLWFIFFVLILIDVGEIFLPAVHSIQLNLQAYGEEVLPVTVVCGVN